MGKFSIKHASMTSEVLLVVQLRKTYFLILASKYDLRINISFLFWETVGLCRLLPV